MHKLQVYNKRADFGIGHLTLLQERMKVLLLSESGTKLLPMHVL